MFLVTEEATKTPPESLSHKPLPLAGVCRPGR